MLRLAFFPLIILILSIVFGVVSFVIYKKIKKGINYTYKKGAKLANDHQQKWTEKEQRKKLPSIIQKGFDDYERLADIHTQLPLEWKSELDPLVFQAKEILDEVTFDTLENNDEKVLNSIRPFFHHSLDALLQFSQKLKKDHAHMTHEQTVQARQNISLFKEDLTSHQKTLQKSRRLDFDIVMAVIKARLKK